MSILKRSGRSPIEGGKTGNGAAARTALIGGLLVGAGFSMMAFSPAYAAWVVGFGVLLTRLYEFQIERRIEFLNQVPSNRTVTIREPGTRGEITDRNGQLLARDPPVPPGLRQGHVGLQKLRLGLHGVALGFTARIITEADHLGVLVPKIADVFSSWAIVLPPAARIAAIPSTPSRPIPVMITPTTPFSKTSAAECIKMSMDGT